jgi:hypothetical protein
VFRKLLKRFRLKSVQAGEGQRSVDNIDAMTSTAQARMTPQGGPATFPPDYVRTEDEGRPRH